MKAKGYKVNVVYFIMEDSFTQRKTSILGKVDKSSKGSWDAQVLELCEQLNLSLDYYTTSSCSGKSILMEEQEGKNGTYYFWTSHNLVSVDEIKKALSEISSKLDAPASGDAPTHPNSEEISDKINSEDLVKFEYSGGVVKFKCQAPILHVGCRTLGFAQKLVDSARKVGWRRSGIMTTGERYIVELCSTENLEFPIMKDGKVIVNDEFLEVLVNENNFRREKGWEKIRKLIDEL